jgi:CMP-N,N'-diacetyllegionaminic acid synthase
MTKILAVITARGGSKGIPDKNKRVFAGKPLLLYTIEAAKAAKRLTRIVLSSDDDGMLEMAKKAGIEVLKRPAELSTDGATSLAVLEHAVTHYEQVLHFKADLIVTLQPVSPMRTAADIDESVDLLLRTKADSVVTVCESEPHPRWLFTIKDDAGAGGPTLVPFLEGDYYKTTRRQDFEKVYKLNGAVVYVTTYDLLMRQHKILGGKLVPRIMESWLSFDLDHPADWAVGEIIFKHQAEIRAHIKRIEDEKAAVAKRGEKGT